MLSLLCLAALPLRADEGCLAALYKRFLTGNQSTGFVAFERNVVYPDLPRRPTLPPGVATGSNQPTQSKSHYYCFLWNGPKFLLVRSDTPITNETDLANATTATRFFSGYDGRVYWRLNANSSTTYQSVDGQPDRLHPLETTSVLTLFTNEVSPLAPANHEPSLPRYFGAVSESRRVAQMGFSLPLAEPPALVTSDHLLLKSLDGRSQTAQFIGSREHPETLEYFAPSNSIGNFRVTLGFQTNTLTIDALSSRRKLRTSTTRYQVLAASVPSSLTASVFSWETYRPATGRLIQETPGEGGGSAQYTHDDK